MEIKKFNFIKDEPSLPGQQGYFNFYHKSFSPALKDMVLSDSCPHTIGLFGKWGTGKSSIIEQLREDLKSEKNTRVFIFDAWKYQEDSLRRTFLIKLEKFLRDSGYEIPKDILSAFYKRKMSSVASSKEVPEQTEILHKNFFIRIWEEYKLIIVFLIIPFLLGVIFNILEFYHPNSKFIQGITSFVTYLNSFVWLGLIASIFLKPIAEKALEKITSKIFESTKTYTEIRTQVEDEDRLNSPEQFEDVFTELVGCINEGKLVIVFDNIDRVQGDIALKILSTIKTFLEVGKSKVIFLVPCDASAINRQIKAFYKNQEKTENQETEECFDESEYLNKLFNVVLYTPEFIDEDLYVYTGALIEQAGDGMKKIIQNEKVLSVITKGFKNNPREIKQFVNNLISAVLVASKTEVANDILSEENIGYFTKVCILKQKFPNAYKMLRENWNDPEKILNPEGKDQELKDFLTLTSPISTNDAEPFIYFKKPQVESELKDGASIRKSLIDGNIEEFEKLALSENNKAKLIQYVARLLRNYKGQARILFSIFKTQIQSFYNLKEVTDNTGGYLDACVSAIELIWANYLELPVSAVFELTSRLEPGKQKIILDLYISALSSEAMKVDANKTFLFNLLDELVKNYSLIKQEQRIKVVEALRQNLGEKYEILLKFNTIEKQKNFVDPDTLRKIIQEVLNNKNLKTFTPTFLSYSQFIIDNGLSVLLLKRFPQLLSLQNSETPATTAAKIEFYDNLNSLFASFKNNIKELTTNEQMETFVNVQNGYNQSSQADELQYKIVIILRWLEAYMVDINVKNQVRDLINNFISQCSKESLEKALEYWNESSRQNFIKEHFDFIKNRSIQDDGVLSVCYENGNEDQKLALVQNLITNKPDHGLAFLRGLGEKLPSRKQVIESLLGKAQAMPIQQRVEIFHFLQGKIAKNDDVNLKQTAIRQFYEYLKSNDQAMVQFGAVMLREAFLSDTDEREIAKEMMDFYNTRSSHLQQFDLPAIEHLVNIEPKLQSALKEKLVFLILSNINHDRPFEIQKPLIQFIEKIKPDSGDYEKDYSDLVQRLLTWPDSEQKNQVVKELNESLKSIPGNKTQEYLDKIKPLVKEIPKEA